MRGSRLTVMCLMLAVAGCAAAMPGYVPPSKVHDKLEAAKQTGGGFDGDGSYRLTDQEQKLDCKHLTGSMTVKILQMRDSGSRKDPSQIAQAAQKTIQPISKSTTYGVSVSEDYRRDRARLDTMNKQLAGKGCRTFDLDHELAPGNSATPTPRAKT